MSLEDKNLENSSVPDQISGKSAGDLQEMPLKDVLGSNFVLGIMGEELDDGTKDIIKEIKPAGIILYSRNCKNKEQLGKLISDLQQTAKEIGHYKFFIMIDEEPGGATRLGTFDDVFLSGKPDWKEIGSRTAAMAEMGINVNLAPVADYPFNQNSFIARRIPVKSVEELLEFNRKFIGISQENNVSAVLKHFPGMGFFTEDPHKKIPDSEINEENFKKSLSIFKDGIDAGADLVMIGHAVYENIDSNITTLSSKMIKGTLVGQLGFKGLIITDDMSDMPLLVNKKMTMAEAVAEALKAGNTMVLFSHRPESTKEIFEEVVEKGQEDSDFKRVANENYREIIKFKESHPVYSFSDQTK